jgi:mono/diheme cytochrome c family protein
MTTKRSFLFVGVAHVFVLLFTLLVFACGEDVNPNPGRRNQTEVDASLGLSAAYSNHCERCHGPSGDGTSAYPRLPGGKDEPAFLAFVRAGKGDMPPFDASQISDADLKADYAILKAR